MDLKGSLTTEEKQTKIDASLDIQMLDLSTIEPFFPQQLNNLSGRLTGKLNVGNTTANPAVNGSILFSSVEVNPSFLNINLRLENEEVVVDNRLIRFDNFSIKDPSGKYSQSQRKY